MNRLAPLFADWGETGHTAQLDSPQDASSAGGGNAFFAPLHYEPNYAYPLLLWLHGPGDDEGQLKRIMPPLSLRNYVAAAPRGVLECAGIGAGFDWPDDEVGITAAARAVDQCRATAARRFHVAPNRIFLGGYLSGGTAALRLALLRPEMFAGAFSIGGPFPSGGAPLARLAAARHLPLLIAQGREADDYPAERACRELKLFHAAGLCVTLRQYPGDDRLTGQMLHDVNVWLMEQITGATAEATA